MSRSAYGRHVPPAKKKKPYSKYRAIKTTVDGRTFDSKAEARRYMTLKQLEQAGEITELRCQVPFDLTAHGMKIGKYIADFTYQEHGEFVVEDVKGVKTAIYNWKKKHLYAEYGIKIREVNVKRRRQMTKKRA